MLKAIKVIKNVGRFSGTVGDSLPFSRLTLVYAGNGKGKSTIAAILRSLGSGDPKTILERHRLSSDEPPRVVVDLGEPAVFADDKWSESEPKIRVFDDQFVDENVHSGLAVEPHHARPDAMTSRRAWPSEELARLGHRCSGGRTEPTARTARGCR